MSEYTSSQPEPVAPMGRGQRIVADVKHRLTTKEGLLGDFDFKFLCMPTLPFGQAKKARRPSPFYSLDEKLPFLVMLVTGFQHSLAMIAGLITPPIIFAVNLNLDTEYQAYMISASLIASGFLSMVQMSRIRIWRNYYLGTGLITVVGTSFATLSTAFSIFNALYANGTCPVRTNADGTITKLACPEAYGALIGTTALVSLWEIGLSMVPPRLLKKIFPPVVTGVAVLLIGSNLVGESGIVNWAGGSSCHNGTGFNALCPNINAPIPLAFGDPRLIGLGFLSFMTIVLVELFGSPFMRNASIVIGLIVGSIVAGAAGYIDASAINRAPAITFLWVKRFPLSIYGPAILPCIAVYTILAVEAIGDITASSEVSRVEVSGDVFDSRIQGGVLADGLAGLLSSLATVTPMSIFAQNNGVIALTRCANRGAGFTCASLIIMYGVLGKLSGIILSIPNSVLGGVTTFLFAQVMTSGIRVLSYLKWTRKDRFVLAASLSFGFGNLMVDDWLTHLFDKVNAGSGLQGFLTSLEIIISTPYLSAFIVGTILNNLLPEDYEPGITRQDPDEVAENLEMGHVQDEIPYKSRNDSEDDEVKGQGMAVTRVQEAK